MFEEQTDQYLIHSHVFSSAEDETNNEKFMKNSIQFSILSHENDGNVIVDDDGDLDLCRPERINMTLGI
jgi:hypothetical protein